MADAVSPFNSVMWTGECRVSVCDSVMWTGVSVG